MSYTQGAASAPERALTETAPCDGNLMAQLKAHDPIAAGRLWQRFAPTVFRLLRCTLGPRAQIDDAVQDVLVRVFRRARRVKTTSDLTLLVLKTTSRVACARLRRRGARWLPFRLRARDANKSGVGHVADGELDPVARFYRVIDRLSAWDRIAFTLHFIEGLGPRKLSAVMGSSWERTRRRLHRGLHRVYEGIKRDPVLRQVGESGRAWRSDGNLALAGNERSPDTLSRGASVSSRA